MRQSMIRPRTSVLCALFAAIIVYTASASAAPIAVSNVDFLDGKGTLSGYFQIDSTTKDVIDWNFTASAFNPAGGSCSALSDTCFPGEVYNPGTGTAGVGLSFGNQQIFFTTTASNGETFGLFFTLGCGVGVDCLGNATDGSTISISSAFEMGSPDFLPYRALNLAHIVVSDPPGTLSLNLVAGQPGNPVPEPSSLLLIGSAIAGLGIWRRHLQLRS